MANGGVDVLAVEELRDREMREVSAADKKILLTKIDGNLHAVDAACPHYGVSLAKGLLSGDRVICPWHKSCFRVTDGALLEPPALDDLRSYPVSVRNGRIFVDISGEAKTATRVPQEKCGQGSTVVIVGAGAAGVFAAETLRKENFGGRIVLISKEAELPYDRTKLSKEFLSGNDGVDKLPLRPENFYTERSIERVTGNVTSISSNVELEDGSHFDFDSLLLAPGSLPRTLDVPGADLGNVFTLRSEKDAQQILEASPRGSRAVLAGGSFIALEAASCFALRKIPTVVVLPQKVPFENQLGAEVGQVFKDWHESHGVEFRSEAKVSRFEGTGVVRQVVLETGERLPADVVVIGIGVRPATDFVRNLKKSEDGGILTDRYLNAGNNIFVAGDAAAHPDRIEHWRVAEQQGRVAAQNILGRKQPFDSVPYFWTNHFGTRFDYLGRATRWDEVIFKAGPQPPAFLAYYVVQGKVVAAAACQHDLEIAALHEAFRAGSELTLR